ncbi:hypothetical protein [Limobrevibacterium gyesilva]|uniref:Uncharacterized protein n=1 Tax=Limobrevibacterium gyesilva TaxID=2991712 RepID=A0AA42CIX0_9PROT|nr:hypothetical protein [Limobrevibacterium gyesilva]MCW3476330.1 hypothetical protein [Limobrevibacterium gyesilva]
MKIPNNVDIRLAILPDLGSGAVAFVIVAPAPLKADLSLLRRPRGLSALLTHDAGLSWPDPRGVAIAETALSAGYPVALKFANLADALTCHGRLVREVRQ